MKAVATRVAADRQTDRQTHTHTHTHTHTLKLSISTQCNPCYVCGWRVNIIAYDLKTST